MFDIDFKNSKKISIAIFGPCFLRDAFGFGKEFGDYSIVEFIQNNPPFGLDCPPLSQISGVELTKEDMDKTNPAWYKWAKINTEKQLLNIIENTKSDYVIISFTELRLEHLKLTNQNGDSTILQNSLGIEQNEVFKKSKYSNLKVESINPLEIDKINPAFIIKSLDIFIEKILSIYKNEQIIFVECYPSKVYIDKNNELNFFGNQKKRIKFLKKYNKYFIKKVKPYVIKVPDSLGDETHKWGKHIYHFTKEFYNYLLACFLVIMRKENNTNKKLKNMYIEYKKEIFKKALPIANNYKASFLRKIIFKIKIMKKLKIHNIF